jgi:hypothetical protein
VYIYFEWTPFLDDYFFHNTHIGIGEIESEIEENSSCREKEKEAVGILIAMREFAELLQRVLVKVICHRNALSPCCLRINKKTRTGSSNFT